MQALKLKLNNDDNDTKIKILNIHYCQMSFIVSFSFFLDCVCVLSFEILDVYHTNHCTSGGSQYIIV